MLASWCGRGVKSAICERFRFVAGRIEDVAPSEAVETAGDAKSRVAVACSTIRPAGGA